MKLRIKGNSLRYRITRSEVAKLWNEGSLKEQTEFVDKIFTYAIDVVIEDQLSVGFYNDVIALKLPKIMIDELYHTDKVGFENNEGPVRLLIEKDFVCIDKVEEDQSDNYPNPSINC